MARGKSFFHTKAFKVTMSRVYGLGAAVVIVGALFKILHWEGANQMLMVGLLTEAFIFAISAFLVLLAHRFFSTSKISFKLAINAFPSPLYSNMGLLGFPPYPLNCSNAYFVPEIPTFCNAQSANETIDWSLIASCSRRWRHGLRLLIRKLSEHLRQGSWTCSRLCASSSL